MGSDTRWRGGLLYTLMGSDTRWGVICLWHWERAVRTQLIRKNRTLIKAKLIKDALYIVTVQMCPFYAAVRPIFVYKGGGNR